MSADQPQEGLPKLDRVLLDDRGQRISIPYLCSSGSGLQFCSFMGSMEQRTISVQPFTTQPSQSHDSGVLMTHVPAGPSSTRPYVQM